jgi:hypothetical protein
MNEMMKKKLSPDLQDMVKNQTLPDPVSLIIMVEGEGEGQARLNDEDRQMIEMVGGTILDDLWIIKGYSADVPAKALEMIVLSSRVAQVHHNSDVTGAEE